MAVREGDNLGGTFAAAIYATGSSTDNGYYGIRRLPYTQDMAKNPFTFTHISDGVQLPQIPMGSGGANNAEVHNAGEIWTSMLFEGYVDMLKQSQMPNPPYTFDEARRMMADYCVAGLLASPIDATITETRDAILAAAYAHDPDNALLLANGFARRGAGSCAVAPDRFSVDFAGVVEGYELNPNLEVVAVDLDDSVISCDTDGLLDGEETGRITVEIRNGGIVPLVASQLTVATTTPGVSFPNGESFMVPDVAP
jgi:hypothetical protein